MPKYLIQELTENQQSFSHIAEFTISACIAIKMPQALWMPNNGQVPFMDHFVRLNDFSCHTFYTCLEKHIAAGDLYDISPILLSPFLNHQAENGNISALPDLISKGN